MSIQRLAEGDYTDDPYGPINLPPKEELIDHLYQEVVPLCEEETDDNDDHTGLWEWLNERNYSTAETPESLAAAYDKMRKG